MLYGFCVGYLCMTDINARNKYVGKSQSSMFITGCVFYGTCVSCGCWWGGTLFFSCSGGEIGVGARTWWQQQQQSTEIL